MLALPLPPQHQRQTLQATPQNQIIISTQPINQKSVSLKLPDPGTAESEKQIIIGWRRRTSPVAWCCAIFCLLFSLLLIFFGIATLIVFLGIKPRNPSFDTPGASLSSIYFDAPEYFNGDFTFYANFSNPNRKISITYEYVDIQLYFLDRLIGTQAIQPFTQKPGESRVEPVHMISSLVYLPHKYAGELQKQVQGYRVMYTLQGKFRVRANLGLTHFSYWLHGRCRIEMTGPPTGTLPVLALTEIILDEGSLLLCHPDANARTPVGTYKHVPKFNNRKACTKT